MMKKCARLTSLLAAAILSLTAPGVARSQSVEGAARAGDLSNRYRIVPNVTYLTANNWDAKLDVYVPGDADPIVPYTTRSDFKRLSTTPASQINC